MTRIALYTNDVMKFQTPRVTQTNKLHFFENHKGNGEQFAYSLTVLTEEDGVPGSKFEREPEEYTVDQLKRWLKCRGLKLSGKREELVQTV